MRKHKNLWLGFLAIALLVFCTPVRADLLDFPAGSYVTTQNIGSVVATITASPRPLELKSMYDHTTGVTWWGVGVDDGYVDGEIDGKDGEKIEVSFSEPLTLSDLTLAFLFAAPSFNAQSNEISVVWETATNEQAIYSLVVQDPASAVWVEWQPDGSTIPRGSVANLSPGDETGAGIWRVDQPFGNDQLVGLKFEALCGGPECFSYAIAGINNPVPEPSSLVLLGLGLLGAGTLARKRLH